MSEIPIIIGEKPQALPMDFVNMDLEQVRAFGPLLVISFSAGMHAIFMPVVDPKTTKAAVQVTLGKGCLPPMVEKSLMPVLPVEAQAVIGRRVVSQTLDFDGGIVALAFDGEYALVVTLPDTVEVYKGLEKLGPKVKDTVN